MLIVAGDIGGTKTHLALVDKGNPREIIQDKKYASRDYKNLEEILHDFLSTLGPIAKACFGIAGPIENNRCHATNLPWIVEGDKISKELKIPQVSLINDLEANAWGISCLRENEFYSLNEGNPRAKGNQGLIAAGTGLGEAGFYWDGKTYHPFACEGGHCDFAPLDQEQVELWRYLKGKYEHVSYERVLSGPGVHAIYQFLIDTGLEKEEETTKKYMEKEDPPKVITERALKKQCKVCMRTLDIFVSIYGSEAGNMALKFLALGGMYIGGGIGPKILEVMKNGLFMKAFLAKGRFANLLSQIPIKLILNENTALLGAAKYANEKK